jgi:signal transduction histidine kinase
MARPPILGSTTPGDARLLRGVRWRLVGWSGAITLAILVLLGGAMYLITARSLAAGAEAQLQERATAMKELISAVAIPPEQQPPERLGVGFGFGGRAPGSFAIIITPTGGVIWPRDLQVTDLPYAPGVTAARQHDNLSVVETTIGSVAVRVLSEPVQVAGSTYVIQIVGDRTAEQRLLSTLFLVLGLGGLGAVVLAVAGGWFYARRAVVPIRDSLRRQREFAADASHELRTPLTILRGSLEDLRRNADRPVAEVGAALNDMSAEVDHMADLVDDLLLLARADSGVAEVQHLPTDLADVAAAALGELSGLASEHRAALRLDAEPTTVSGDPSRLRQLVAILVDNAIRHGRAPVEVDVSIHRDGQQALLRVEDSGPGIRADDLPHVFDRFWRASDAPEGGNGLGLAIASWIAERHGGSISAGNRPEGGARFEVRIPAAT